MSRPTTIAIDGPVASGKTEVGRRVARALGFRFLDTGLLYRAVAWAAIRWQVPASDQEGLGRLAGSVGLEFPGGAPGPRVTVQGEDATPFLREAAVEESVSRVSGLPAVRQALLGLQRGLAAEGGVVMVGRDIGTVVLPGAGLKLFLTASPGERARRRHLEMEAAGAGESVASVLRAIEARDLMDSSRAISPLRPAPDAHQVDTEGLTVEGVVERVLELAGCRG